MFSMKDLPTIGLTFVLQLIVLTSFGQDIDMHLSEEIPLRPYDEYQGLVHADDSGYILHLYERSGKGLLDKPGRMLILEKYDLDYNQTYSYEYGDDDLVSVELFAVANGLAWIVLEKTSPYKYRYSLIPIDFNGKEGAKQQLLDIEVNKGIDIPYTFMRPSPDSSKVAFVALFDANKKKRQTEIYTAIINENAQLEWDSYTSMKGNQKQYDILDFQLSADDKLLFLSKYYRDEKAKNEVDNKRGEKTAGYKMNIYTLGAKDTRAQKYSIGLDDTFVHDAALKTFASGDIYCAGLTTERHKGNINGIYMTQFSNDMNTIVSKSSDFDIRDLIYLDKADADVKFNKKDNQGLDREYELIDFIRLPDGSFIITAEENYLRTQTSNFNSFNSRAYNNNQNSTFLNSNDIVTIRINQDADITALAVIPKKQSNLVYSGFNYFNPSDEKTRAANLYLSHTALVNEDGYYFLYNEDKDNFNEPKRRRIADRTRRMVPAIVQMNQDFSFEIMPLVSPDTRTLLSPTRSVQLKTNQLFVTLVPPQSVGNQYIKIGTLTIDK